MKKTIVLSATILSLFALTACSNSKTSGNQTKKESSSISSKKEEKSSVSSSKVPLDSKTSEETFDTKIKLHLTRSQTNKAKADQHYQLLRKTANFDYLPPQTKGIYPLELRVVRVKISENLYESLVTNLDPFTFTSKELKELYHLRWGIETSFRELKYALGLSHFHARKLDFIIQEIYARLIMYNFSMAIALAVAASEPIKSGYQLNFTQAIGICKKFFLFPAVNVEELIRRHILPVRPNRSDQRKLTKKKFGGFLYRVA